MSEKILAQGKPVDRKSVLLRFLAVPAVLLAIVVLYYALDTNGSRHISTYMPSTAYTEGKVMTYDLAFSRFLVSALLFDTSAASIYMSVVLYLGLAALAWGVFQLLKYRSMAITVTEDRIFGVTAFGKQVDLPVSAVISVSSAGKGDLLLMTPGGKVLFGGFQNRDELFHAISGLLTARQK